MFRPNSVSSSQPQSIPIVRNVEHKPQNAPPSPPPSKVENDGMTELCNSVRGSIGKPGPIKPDPKNFKEYLTNKDRLG